MDDGHGVAVICEFTIILTAIMKSYSLKTKRWIKGKVFPCTQRMRIYILTLKWASDHFRQKTFMTSMNIYHIYRLLLLWLRPLEGTLKLDAAWYCKLYAKGWILNPYNLKKEKKIIRSGTEINFYVHKQIIARYQNCYKQIVWIL